MKWVLIFIGLYIVMILGYLLICFISDIFFERWKARELKHMMQIHYVGKIKDIRNNLDMFCTYRFCLDRNYDLSDEDKTINVYFKLKDENKSLESISYKFWRINERDTKSFDKFIDKYYNVEVEIF